MNREQLVAVMAAILCAGALAYSGTQQMPTPTELLKRADELARDAGV
jgi:hypothetical protein